MLSNEHIIAYQSLYHAPFGKDISRAKAFEQMKLVA